MDWSNLVINKCPKCSEDLTESAVFSEGMFECNCGFKIRESKYKEIVSKIKLEEFEGDEETFDDVYN